MNFFPQIAQIDAERAMTKEPLMNDLLRRVVKCGDEVKLNLEVAGEKKKDKAAKVSTARKH